MDTSADVSINNHLQNPAKICSGQDLKKMLTTAGDAAG
jgi:hypothetical protein